MHTSCDVNNELLYALALTQHPRSERSKSAAFLSYVTRLIRERRLVATEFEELMEHLRREEDYQNERLPFKFHDGSLFFVQMDTSGNRVDVGQHFHLPMEQIVEELEVLHHRYQEAKDQGVTPERGLLSFLDEIAEAQEVVLEVLARAQRIRHSQVAVCWWMIEYAIHHFCLPADALEEFVGRATRSWSGYGCNDFGMETDDNGIMRVTCAGAECSCPAGDMTDELRELLRRFYEVI